MKTINIPRKLTTRELEVLDRIACGYNCKQISEELLVSKHTIQKHITSLIWKLNAKNRVNAVAIAVQMSLVNPLEEIPLEREQTEIVVYDSRPIMLPFIEKTSPDSKKGSLTKREREILELFCDSNITNRQISEQLHLSHNTVRTHIRNITKKLGQNGVRLHRDEFQFYALSMKEASES